MSSELQRTCPSCGNEFSGAMEFCPVCMLRNGIAGGVESGESSSEDTVRRRVGRHEDGLNCDFLRREDWR